jgi:hypothetical protein
MENPKNRSVISTALNWLLAVALLILPGTLWAASAIGTGEFPNAQQIEHALVRGQSTRVDVQRLLGIPSGGGSALLPGHGSNSNVIEPYDIWYYEDIELGDVTSDRGTMTMSMRQQILMILFKGDKFHGYFWTSNEPSIEAQSR